jgi:hypothetical protein
LEIELRLCLLSLCLYSCALVCPSAYSQSSTPSVFQEKVQAAVSGGKPFSVLNLTAAAEWTAGSTHESGTAQLQAKIDGSSNVQLSLGQASRTEVQTKADSSRSCQWTDGAGTTHATVGANCFIAIPWFAPGLFTQPVSQLPVLLATTDDGEVSKNGSALHQVGYLLNLQGADSTSTNQMVSQSTVKVFYDPQTSLPDSLEYFVHPDSNDLQNIPVRVVFRNYQSVSGIMLPFHVEKYVNRTLQLALDITNASIE